MSELLRDLRLGTRLLVKSPVFTLTAVLLLAIGISTNTLIFSVVNALLLRPLPVSHPENLVRLVEVHPNNFVTWELPHSFCPALADRDTSLSEVICQGETDLPLSDGKSTDRVRVHFVSPNFFSSLGVSAVIGRVLTAEDEQRAAANVVLSYDFWRRRFQGDTSVAGRSVTLRGRPFTIVGVVPEAFNGLTVDTSPDVRVPLATNHFVLEPVPGMNPTLRLLPAEIFGRLRGGVSLERASAAADPLLHAAYEEELTKGRDAPPAKGAITSRLELESVANGISTLRGQFSRGLEVLMAGVVLLLVMACANVAGLLLGRSAARAGEMGIRVALGASPVRIVRQLLTEGLLLALAGGVAGMLLTRLALPLLVDALPPIRDRGAVLQPLALRIDIDLRVLAFAIAITFATAVLFALSPALRCARTDVVSALKDGRTTTARMPLRNLIVASQVAVCTLILIGASLLVQTLERMQSMDPGFDRDHVVTFTLDPSLRAYTPEQSRALSKVLLAKTRVLPGVTAASIASRGLMRGTGVKMTLGATGTRLNRNDFLNCSLNGVTPDYFKTMGMRLLAGRDFNWFDHNRGAPLNVVVNQTFARRFFPGRNPIGELVGGADPSGIAKAADRIIGVVSDSKYRSLREPVPPTVYGSEVDGFDSGFILHVRTEQHPDALIGPVRRNLRSLDPEIPFIEVQTLREAVDVSLWQERLLAVLSSLFGAIATLLTGIGLYGALDYAVKSRRREIGVRMALGAGPARIIGLISREVLLTAATGFALGLCAYAMAAVWISRILYEVRPWEPLAVTSVVLIVGLVAVASAAPAACQAARTEPAAALRSE
jgi:predicted permease